MTARLFPASRLVAVLALVVVCAAAVGAVGTQPLPAFQVSSVDGRQVSSAQLSAEDRWLVVYVAPDCSPCDKLLDAFGRWQLGTAAHRIIVIAGGRPDKIQPLLSKRSGDATGLGLYGDLDGSAARALAVASFPTVIGVEQGQIEWSIAGVLNDPSALETAVRKWLE